MTADQQEKTGSEPLVIQVGEALRRLGWTIATAESCTGGLLSHWLTDVPGSSEYFLGGTIAYADSAKTEQLGVRQATLEKHGSVSAACAREQAQGARERYGATAAVAITCIAGPGGATATKPLGLTYIGAARGRDLIVERHRFTGDRQQVKQAAAEAGLKLILRLTTELS